MNLEARLKSRNEPQPKSGAAQLKFRRQLQHEGTLELHRRALIGYLGRLTAANPAMNRASEVIR